MLKAASPELCYLRSPIKVETLGYPAMRQDTSLSKFAKVKVWKVAQMGTWKDSHASKLMLNRYWRGAEQKGSGALKPMTLWRITHVSPSPHAHRVSCMCKQSDWGIYQGAWITISVSINQEQLWVGEKAPICSCWQKEGSQQTLTLQQHHPCVSHVSSWANARKSQSWQQPDHTPEHVSLQGQSQQHFCIPWQGWKVKA